AAGDKQGESYIISDAIAKVIEKRSNIKVNVITTGGTKENLQLLEKGDVHLATAQADVVSENIDVSTNTNNSSKPSFRTVAILYKDLFQLVVRDPKIQDFIQLKGKTIALPVEGGQYKSFQKVARHYRFFNEINENLEVRIKGLEIQGYDDKQAEEDFKFQRADALFRVRAAGNQGISLIVQNYGGRLVGIDQAEAMKIKHPAFEATTIPRGAYKGNPAVPEKDLPTIAVSRLLITSNKVDDAVIRDITQIILENRQDIANAIAQEHPEVKPLVATISKPDSQNDSAVPPLHAGAISFYDRDKPSFVQENADFLALVLTIILLCFSWIKNLKSWVASGKKNEADEYIELSIALMSNTDNELQERLKKFDDKLETLKQQYQGDFRIWIEQKIEPQLKQLQNTGQNDIHNDIELRQQILDLIFERAAKALDVDNISQESFRTFNEAYKTARETIERQQQRAQQGDNYIDAAIQLMGSRQISLEDRQNQLDQVFNNAAVALLNKQISQEAFRTFNEAYKTSRETIEREKQISYQVSEQSQNHLLFSYINEVMQLLPNTIPDKNLQQKELDKIFQKVVADLITKKLSQESFRTFMEAYKNIYNTIK
ncbi:TAXI family TRAP transporter solute-binding subunit, partial [Calothrix sp. UHCC 0171]|uniref:TAXI family TRAP transporter solute-binding subunit n=1 Tax=Calothrix sp. UHCC 0171 TaxID=3110245 RepID=UPI002B2191FC